jgi:hypothetical protein
MNRLRTAILVVLFYGLSFPVIAQETWISWHEGDVEFKVSAPSGQFSYQLYKNASIKYIDYGPNAGKIKSIGYFNITYYDNGPLVGKVRRVNNVVIKYEEYGKYIGRVSSVGNLRIDYEKYGINEGRIRSFSGKVIY